MSQPDPKPPHDAVLTVMDAEEREGGNFYLVEWYSYGLRCECWLPESELESADDPS